MTRVEELRKEIKVIQAHCSHEWAKDHEIAPVESLVSGTYIGHTAGPIMVGSSSLFIEKVNSSINLTCGKCSETFEGTISFTCPKCMVKLVEGLLTQRERYFGIDYIYYGVRLKSCPQCYFQVACDEWDQ